MAAVLAFGTAACSSDDYAITEQPENPTEKTYTMTIQASKGDDATMRGLYFADGENSKDLRVNWNGKEKVRVVQDGKVIGTLSAALSSTESTTLTGTVTGFQNNHDVGFYLLADENVRYWMITALATSRITTTLPRMNSQVLNAWRRSK